MERGNDMKAGDLIYCGNEIYTECKEEIIATFPDAVFEDASDEIHGRRFAVEVDASQKDLDLFLLEYGYLHISLKLLLHLHSDDGRAYLKELLAEVEAKK